MTDQDDVARDLVQHAHAEEVRPAFDVEAGMSDVLARAEVEVLRRTILGPVTSRAVASSAHRIPLPLGESSAVESHSSRRRGVPAGDRAFTARSTSRADTSQPRSQTSPEGPRPTALLGPLEWHTLEQRGRRRIYERGQVLFFEGDQGGSVIALRSGRAKVSVQTLPGRELLLAVKRPGELIGEMSALDGRPRSATATAMMRCRPWWCRRASSRSF